MIRVLVVDDEPTARERLCQLLASHDDVEIAGEAEDGETAMQQIVELRPDLVFLDIQMPGCSGIEVAASLPSPRPRIIFCTAFDQYAVDAFEVHAVDYLLKPVSRARLAEAVQRVRGLSELEAEAAVENAGEADAVYPKRFLAKRGTRYHVVPREDVAYFASEEGLTKLRTAEHNYWMPLTLGELEVRLDPEEFFRVSRAAIVHLDAVTEVVPGAGGNGEVRLNNGETLDVSRRRFKTLIHRLAR
ncbi:MAG: response regulator [Acidobacteriota bacterium]|nr:response regulator [Acidobacteriota bacterium]